MKCLFDRCQVPSGHPGVEDEQVAAAAMKQLEMLMPSFGGTNAAGSVRGVSRTLYSGRLSNACSLPAASSGRTRPRRPTAVEDVDRSEAAPAPGPENGMERPTPSTGGNGLLAGATVHPAHPEGASARVGTAGGTHPQTDPLQTSLWSETSTMAKSAALCSLVALFSWRASGEFPCNSPLILVPNL